MESWLVPLIAVEITEKKIKLGRLLLGFRVLSFHNFSNLGGQLKTGHDDAFGEKRKGGLL